MDYTQSPQNVVDATTGFRRHEDNQALPTVVSEKDINSLIWSLMEVNKAAGVPAAAFDETVQSTYTDVIRAIRRLCGGNITTFTGLAGGSAFQLTVDQAGLVLINAAAGAVTLTLPAANAVLTVPLEYQFERVDASANLVTVAKSAIAANVDTINGVASFTLSGQYVGRAIRSDSQQFWASVQFQNATAAQAQAQTDNTVLLTPLSLAQAFQGGNRSTGSSGYQKLPGGLILQWGGTPAGSATSDITVVLPIAFPNQFFGVQVTSDYTPGSGSICFAASAFVSLASFVFRANFVGVGCRFTAIGF